MTEQTAEQTSVRGASDNDSFAIEEDGGDAFAHGSLGRLSPAWWEPEDGSEPEPWATADEALDRFLVDAPQGVGREAHASEP